MLTNGPTYVCKQPTAYKRPIRGILSYPRACIALYVHLWDLTL